MATQPGRMNIVVSKVLHKKLKAQADKEGRLLQRIVEDFLNEGLKSRTAA